MHHKEEGTTSAVSQHPAYKATLKRWRSSRISLPWPSSMSTFLAISNSTRYCRWLTLMLWWHVIL